MNYPNGILKNNNNLITHSNRGMSLEEDLNQTNDYYLKNDIAIIHKKPTAITIKKVDYKKNDMICEAYFKTPSTTDYNGIYKGYYIDFEAKETRNKTSFPLANIHKHQIEHIRKVIVQKGIAFLIVRFVLLNETFVLMGSDLLNFIESTNRKSIPKSYFELYGYKVELKYNPRLDYIGIISNIIKDKEVDNNEGC